jgi:hypothetical protein
MLWAAAHSTGNDGCQFQGGPAVIHRVIVRHRDHDDPSVGSSIVRVSIDGGWSARHFTIVASSTRLIYYRHNRRLVSSAGCSSYPWNSKEPLSVKTGVMNTGDSLTVRFARDAFVEP